MPTVLAPRCAFGVIVPSTNTAVEDEYNRMRPDGVSFHAGRIRIENESLDSDEVFESFLAQLRLQIERAVESVLTCKPDCLIMGMSAQTFWGGAKGNAEFEAWIEELSGLPVASGASACRAALRLFGAKRIAVITPYQPVADEQVRGYFEEIGFEVTDVVGLKCPTATSIADVPPDRVRRAFLEVDSPDVDVLVQAGTNLPVVKVAAELERELGKPIVAINAASLWHALRTQGINERIAGHGRLLEEF